jgi:hypothetical protein
VTTKCILKTLDLITEINPKAKIHYFDYAENYDKFRKPQPHMLQTLANVMYNHERFIDLEKSFVVGDSAADEGFANLIGFPFFDANTFFGQIHEYNTEWSPDLNSLYSGLLAFESHPNIFVDKLILERSGYSTSQDFRKLIQAFHPDKNVSASAFQNAKTMSLISKLIKIYKDSKTCSQLLD